MSKIQVFQNRYGWLDLSRGFLMCLVFLYHSEVFYGHEHLWSWLFAPIFLTGFFFVSGYLFTSDWKKLPVMKKWKQVVRGILIPYMIFMLAFLLPKLVLLHYDWRESVQDIFLLRASWFVIAVGVLQILYAVTLKYCNKVNTFVIASILYGLIGYGCILLYRDLPDWYKENALLYSSAMPGCMPACVNLVFLSSPFFSLGILYRKYEDKLKLNANAIMGFAILAIYLGAIILDHNTLSTGFTFASCSSDNLFLVIVYFLLAMATIIMLCKKIDTIKPLNYIGENTLLFYYFNILMLRVAGIVYDKGVAIAHLNGVKDSLGYGNKIIVTLIAIACTFPVVWFINKYLPLLTGKREAYNNISKKLGLNINW